MKKKLVKAKIINEITNSLGTMKVNEVCYVKEVWINSIEGDIDVKLESENNELLMITSISNIEIIK